MPYYKVEINFKTKDERIANDIESRCYDVVKNVLGDYKDITMDLVFEIPEKDRYV